MVERGEIRSECWVLWLETGVFVVGFTDLYVGFWGLEFGLRVSELGSEGLNWGFRFFLYLFSGFAFLIAAVFVGDAAVSGLVFFIFLCWFAGIHLQMWCLRFAKRRKCGVKCRNGCDLGDLRDGFWRLRIGFGGLEVVLIGLFISKMVVRIVKTEFSCFVFFIFHVLFAGIHL